jgi:putative holliday junction resolvase
VTGPLKKKGRRGEREKGRGGAERLPAPLLPFSLSPLLHPAGRLLGVDHGRVRVGLAVCDEDRIIASPLDTYTRRSRDLDAVFFKELAVKERIVQIVVGMPVHLDGRHGEQADLAKKFGRWLGEVTGLPFVFWDERFSTSQAESALWEAGLSHKKRKSRRDRVAAQIFLQHYIDAGCPEQTEPGGLE